MSFILEALKKSEQQRQQQNASLQLVRKRTLSLPYRQSRFRYYWLLTAVLSLLAFCAWWVFNNMEISSGLPRVVAQTIVEKSSPAVAPQTATPGAAAQGAIIENAPQPVVVIAEPAPVPSVPSEFAPVPARSRVLPADHASTASEPHPVDAFTPAKLRRASEPVTKAGLKPSEQRTSERAPLYLELSSDLRDQLPHLAMSMHFYTTDPSRRLARINGRLLREGDLVEQDLRIIEITPYGAILDFLGNSFEIRSPSR